MGSGNSLTDTAERYSLGRSTVGYIVRQVCQVIWTVMREETLPPNISEDKWYEIADGFQKRTQFPHCIGAIDGKHIRIISPYHSASLFFNYKKFFSLVLLALADANYCFTYINVGAYGKDADPTIFEETTFFKALQQNQLNIPQSRPLPDGTSKLIPFTIVGDEAFSLSNHIMRPYAGKQLPMKKRIFNYRLSRARRNIECTFGILANKWRIFHRPMDTSVDVSETIVKACCVLHNYVRVRDGYQFQDTFDTAALEDITPTQDAGHASRGSANSIRDTLADYFMSNAGKLPWQEAAISCRPM